MQFDLDLELPAGTIHTLLEMPFGEPFRFSGFGKPYRFYMRVKPIQWVLNSNLLSDCINRGKCFVVALDKGNFQVVDGSREVIPVRLTPLKYLGDITDQQQLPLNHPISRTPTERNGK